MEEGKRIELYQRSYSIGRSQETDISLQEDLFVSGKHAEIKINEDDTVILSDTGSKNGTYLLGEEIKKPVKINPGDIFRVAKTFSN